MGEIDYSQPFRVTILEDCRPIEKYGPLGDLSGKPGWCLGEFESLEFGFKTPLLPADGGDYISGPECWWEARIDVAGEIPLEKKANSFTSS